MAFIKSLVELLLALWRAFRLWQDSEDSRLAKEAEERRQEREKAIEDLEKAIEANDEEAIWDAQRRIVANKP